MKTATDLLTMRGAFEEWARGPGASFLNFNLDRDDEGYTDGETFRAFKAFQAGFWTADQRWRGKPMGEEVE